MPEQFDDLEIDRQMPGFVGVDLLEHVLTHRVVDLVHDELHQRAVQGHLEHRNDGAQHGRDIPSEYLSSQSMTSLTLTFGCGHPVTVEHAPPTHESELGVGVLLLFGVEVAVDLAQSLGRCLERHGREAAGADVLDPHQIGHEGLEFGVQFGADGLGSRAVPVDVGQMPTDGP